MDFSRKITVKFSSFETVFIIKKMAFCIFHCDSRYFFGPTVILNLTVIFLEKFGPYSQKRIRRIFLLILEVSYEVSDKTTNPTDSFSDNCMELYTIPYMHTTVMNSCTQL